MVIKGGDLLRDYFYYIKYEDNLQLRNYINLFETFDSMEV